MLQDFQFSEMVLILQVDALESYSVIVYFYLQFLCSEPMHFLKTQLRGLLL